jgi:hypothetical protein
VSVPTTRRSIGREAVVFLIKVGQDGDLVTLPPVHLEEEAWVIASRTVFGNHGGAENTENLPLTKHLVNTPVYNMRARRVHDTE